MSSPPAARTVSVDDAQLFFNDALPACLATVTRPAMTRGKLCKLVVAELNAALCLCVAVASRPGSSS